MDAEVAKLQATIARDQQVIQAASKAHYTFMKGPGARMTSVVIPIGLVAVSAAGLVRGECREAIHQSGLHFPRLKLVETPSC